MPIRITRHTAQQNNKAFVLTRHNTYQFSWCLTCLLNSLPNEAILAIKQDCFIVLAKKYLCDQ